MPSAGRRCCDGLCSRAASGDGQSWASLSDAPAGRQYLPRVNVCRGVLALTLVVRDEEDILAANLDYHLAQGVDVILVIDHGSVDSTPAILTEYASTGRVRSFRDEARPHLQAARVNRLLKIAAEEHQADWVIHCDADEFWMPAAGSLRDVFGAIPDRYGFIQVEASDALHDAELRARAPQARLDAPQAALDAQQARLNVQQAQLDAIVRKRDVAITWLSEQLAAVRGQAQQLRTTLEVVRNSRIMRYSAPARRAYYRIRP